MGVPYSSTVAASGGATPYTYSATSLPSGLAINAATGAITGIPAQSAIGAATATVTVTDSTQPTPQSATANLTVRIHPAAVSITTTSLPSGTAGLLYPSTTLQASGGMPPYLWSLAAGSNLPAGLTLSTGGVLSGTPAVSSSGTYALSVVATDSFSTPDTATAALTLTISAGTANLTLTTTSLAPAVLNAAYSANLVAAGGVTPYMFSLANGSALPAGLTLSGSGMISGTPTTVGSTTFSVVVADSSTPTPLSATGILSLNVSSTPGPQCGNMSTGNGASLNGYVPFPSSNLWNTDISSASVDPNSATIIGALSGSHLHPDFSNIADGNYGIPYVVVDSSVTPSVPVTMTTYQSESDITPFPIPATAPIEGSPANCTNNGDNHLLVIDKNKCWIYETWQTQFCNGAWNAANGALWDLTTTEHRPYGWTSADAAGLPIFPGLVRYDEVAAGAIHHAFRITLAQPKVTRMADTLWPRQPTQRETMRAPATSWVCDCGSNPTLTSPASARQTRSSSQR